MAAIPEDVLKKMAADKKAAEDKLEKILSDFEKAHDTKTSTPGKNLRELLEKSPDLRARILDSVQKGHLEKFDVLPAGANAGGQYSPDSKTIDLPADYLKKAGKDKAAAAELVFVMGHEIQHSFNSTASDVATDKFVKAVDKIAKGPGPHDYTAAVKTLIQNYREDEAGAHIGGFNAIASQVMKDNPKAGLKEIYNAHPGRMDDFIDRSGKAPKFTYALKPGLTLEADNTLKSTPENVKAMGKHYFDQPPSATRLGPKGNQDYPNYYGEWALNVIADAEKRELAAAKKADPKAVAPEVKINMAEIGLKAALMDTGLKYKDSSPKKPIEQLQEATQTTGHGVSSILSQATRSIEKIVGDLGLKNDTEKLNVAAAAAVQAVKAGMERIDGALLSKTGQLFMYQGDPTSESADRIPVDVTKAKQQPAEQSMASIPAEQTAPSVQAPQQTKAPNL
jgi:hypothetical protein